MKYKLLKRSGENPLNELDEIKIKGFEELENQDLKDFNPDNFRKSRLKEFNDCELKDFKNFVEESRTDRDIENLKLELNSRDAIENIIKELESIGISSEGPLNILKRIKKSI